MNGIFREEALEYKKSRWTGKALIISKIPLLFYIIISVFFISIALFMFLFLDITRKETVIGEVISKKQPVNISVTQQSIVIKKFVNVGDYVKKGQKIYQLDISKVTKNGNLGVNTVNSINYQVEKIDDIIKKTIDSKEMTKNNIETQINLYKKSNIQNKDMELAILKSLNEAKLSLDNYRIYLKKGMINKEQLTNQSNIFYQQQVAYQGIRNQINQDSLMISNLENDLKIKMADFDTQIYKYESQKIDLQKQLSEANANNTLFILSPIDGFIDTLNVNEGQLIDPGENIIKIIRSDESGYQLILWVPSSSVPYLNVKDKIKIRYDSFPYQKFGQFSGSISMISKLPISKNEMLLYSSSPVNLQSSFNTSFYKVIVELDNQSIKYKNKTLYLSNGLKAEAILFLEKRPLYQWVTSSYYDSSVSEGK
ncbi:HlyD family secretion protein [Providencia stuartii]|uniref:HlyD family secretion protein n=1 Tax=Providencia stuartii TaxID=588 RepID=UPI0014951A24|nr:HlyD family efflux transporter periplasmic adaptor subunit [Providencia stuartii]NPD41901.1 HlyD family efflux transporter periplasmic adaptor subunit [Providencia stuartii]NPD93453.1 HlyD family efflux transporter periplasmic adaptor subunit [Providencia stuartii]